MNLSYLISWYLFRALYATMFRWRVVHPEYVPETGPVILASNHASYLDPPLVCAGIRRPVCTLARESLFRNPISGAILRSWSVLPVDRDGGSAKGLRVIMDRLRQGSAILLFPEGTRTYDGNLQPARAGLGLIIIKSDAPVVPVRLVGTYEAFGRHRRFPRPHRIALIYGPPIDFDALRAEAKTAPKPRLKEIYQEASDRVMAAIAALEPPRN
jgi:1-acyl-sn-glycerol-3-phosphate acyltransferase